MKMNAQMHAHPQKQKTCISGHLELCNEKRRQPIIAYNAAVHVLGSSWRREILGSKTANFILGARFTEAQRCDFVCLSSEVVQFAICNLQVCQLLSCTCGNDALPHVCRRFFVLQMGFVLHEQTNIQFGICCFPAVSHFGSFCVFPSKKRSITISNLHIGLQFWYSDIAFAT